MSSSSQSLDPYAIVSLDANNASPTRPPDQTTFRSSAGPSEARRRTATQRREDSFGMQGYESIMDDHASQGMSSSRMQSIDDSFGGPNRQFSFGLGDGEAGTFPLSLKQQPTLNEHNHEIPAEFAPYSSSRWIPPPSSTSTNTYPSQSAYELDEPEEIDQDQQQHSQITPPPSAFLSTNAPYTDHRSPFGSSVSASSFNDNEYTGGRAPAGRSRASSNASLYGSPAEGSIFGEFEEQTNLQAQGSRVLDTLPGLVGQAMRGLSMDENLSLPESYDPQASSSAGTSPFASHGSSPAIPEETRSSPAHSLQEQQSNPRQQRQTRGNHPFQHPQPVPQHQSTLRPNPPTVVTNASITSGPSPPTLIIPPSDLSSSSSRHSQSSPIENLDGSIPSLFPPFDPRILGYLARQGGSPGLSPPGGVQINIQAATPTSPMHGQFGSHLAALNAAARAAQELTQQQQLEEHHRRLLQQQQQQFLLQQQQAFANFQASSQPPLYTLDQYRAFNIQQQAIQQAQQAHQQQLASQLHPLDPPSYQFSPLSLQQQQQQQQQPLDLTAALYAQTAGWASSPFPQPNGLSFPQQQQQQPQQPQQQQRFQIPISDSSLAFQQSFGLSGHNMSPFQPTLMSSLGEQQQQSPTGTAGSRALKPPPRRQRSKSEASLLPYDLDLASFQAPTMDPNLLPGRDSRPSFLRSTSSQTPSFPNPEFFMDPPPANGSNALASNMDDPLVNPTPPVSFSFFLPGSDLDAAASTGGDDFEGGKLRGRDRHERASFGATSGLGRLGPGTPNYGVGMQNPWALQGANGGSGGSGSGSSSGGLEVPGGGANLRRTVSQGDRKGHRRAKSDNPTAGTSNGNHDDFLRSITRADGTLGVPAPVSNGSSPKHRSGSPTNLGTHLSPHHSPLHSPRLASSSSSSTSSAFNHHSPGTSSHPFPTSSTSSSSGGGASGHGGSHHDALTADDLSVSNGLHSRERSQSPVSDLFAVSGEEESEYAASVGMRSRANSMNSIASSSGGRSVTKVAVTTEKTAAASKTRRKSAAAFACPVEGCSSTFTRSFNLKGHLRSHTDERPFTCDHCGKGFARAHDCKRHMALHGGKRPFACKACKKDFARQDALNRHLKSDAGKICVSSGKMQPPPDDDGPSSNGGGGGGGGGDGDEWADSDEGGEDAGQGGGAGGEGGSGKGVSKKRGSTAGTSSKKTKGKGRGG